MYGKDGGDIKVGQYMPGRISRKAYSMGGRPPALTNLPVGGQIATPETPSKTIGLLCLGCRYRLRNNHKSGLQCQL